MTLLLNYDDILTFNCSKLCNIFIALTRVKFKGIKQFCTNINA